MGLSVEREQFTSEEYQAFSDRLYECLSALKILLRQPGFGASPRKIGAELENYIVNSDGDVLALNTEIIEKTGQPDFTVELNRFNLEINFSPVDLNATAFSNLQANMAARMDELKATATTFGADIVATGILPTLKQKELTREYMTEIARYRGLAKYLSESRGEDFYVHICGEDDIQLTSNHVALEGANTSFQYHLMVGSDEFADCFNATQLVTPLLVAVSANSPILLSKMLWDETRIALFKQSIDSRARNTFNWKQPARVSFGHGWVRDNAWELFAESVALYPPIFPVLSCENPLDTVANGQVPQLEELCLHSGTTWPWNRPVYSQKDGGHIRIEMRALPAGPSIVDMCASAAFATGLIEGLKHNMRDVMAFLPFRFAEYNFYRAAKMGLDASVVWTQPDKHELVELPIVKVISALLPVAERGLHHLGVGEDEVKYYLTIIENRLVKKMTGARWQKQVVKHFEQKCDRKTACQRMFQLYMKHQKSGAPVSEWDFPNT